jgi:hypothetical protein
MVVINYVKLYEAYISNSDLIFNNESKPFEKGTYSDKMLLTMSGDLRYLLPGFHGRLYWLNYGWSLSNPIFNNSLRNQKVTLIIFKQIEGETLFDNARRFFHKNTLYVNDKVIIVNLGISSSVFLNDRGQTNKDYVQSYLSTLRNKINKSNY